MKTLLRNAQTGLYVQAAGEWTGKPDEALDFRTMRQAIRFADQAGFRKMELAFLSEHSQCPPPVALDVLRTRLSVSTHAD
jgi:hypothetical protein